VAGLIRDPAGAVGATLWFTLQAEWWVRARVAPTA